MMWSSRTPRGPELLSNGLHETRLAAPADPGEDLDHAVGEEPADLLEVVLALEQTHTDPNLSTGASIANIVFIGVFLAELTIYTPITAEFSIPTRSCQKFSKQICLWHLAQSISILFIIQIVGAI